LALFLYLSVRPTNKVCNFIQDIVKQCAPIVRDLHTVLINSTRSEIALNYSQISLRGIKEELGGSVGSKENDPFTTFFAFNNLKKAGDYLLFRLKFINELIIIGLHK